MREYHRKEPRKKMGCTTCDSEYCADAAEIIFKRYSGRSDQADDRELNALCAEKEESENKI